MEKCKVRGRRREENKKRTEAEGDLPVGVTRFPTSTSSSSSASALVEKEHQEVAKHVASLLNLPMSEELCAVVQEFLPISTLSVTGEAIEARAWIMNTRRNSKQQQMTPAFFRRWLRRAQQSTHSLVPSSPATSKSGSEAGQETAAEQDQYAAYVYKLMEHYSGPEALQRVV